MHFGLIILCRELNIFKNRAAIIIIIIKRRRELKKVKHEGNCSTNYSCCT